MVNALESVFLLLVREYICLTFKWTSLQCNCLLPVCPLFWHQFHQAHRSACSRYIMFMFDPPNFRVHLVRHRRACDGCNERTGVCLTFTRAYPRRPFSNGVKTTTTKIGAHTHRGHGRATDLFSMTFAILPFTLGSLKSREIIQWVKKSAVRKKGVSFRRSVFISPRH